MEEELVVGLVLFAVSGLAYVAYQHPDLYEKQFFGKIAFACLAIFLYALGHYIRPVDRSCRRRIFSVSFLAC